MQSNNNTKTNSTKLIFIKLRLKTLCLEMTLWPACSGLDMENMPHSDFNNGTIIVVGEGKKTTTSH